MTADALLEDLRNSRTDLMALVTSVRDTRRSRVIVSWRAVHAWTEREPQSWRKVRDWLTAEGVDVTLV